MDEETLLKQRIRRKLSGNAVTKRYEKTKKGYLVRTYRNMLSRVRGILTKKRHLYEGKEILEKEVFYAWSLSSVEYNTIFDEWESLGHPIRFSPSVDRIDPSLGYSLDNIQWIPFHENCAKITRVKK